MCGTAEGKTSGKIELVNCSPNNVKKRAYITNSEIPEGTTVLMSKGVVLKNTTQSDKLLEKVSDVLREGVKSFHLFLEAINTTQMGTLKDEIYTNLYPTEAQLVEISEAEKIEAALVVASYLRAVCQDLCEETMVRLYLVMKYNVFRINTDCSMMLDQLGFFPSASYINHSCWPNCIGYYSSRDDAFLVRTIEKIPAGTQLTVSYISIFFPKSIRTNDLKSVAYFLRQCECPRCTSSDGQYLSNIDAYLEGFDCPIDGCKGPITQFDKETCVCRACNASFPWETYSQFIDKFDLCLKQLEDLPRAAQLKMIADLKKEASERKMHRFHSYLIHLSCIEARIRKKYIILKRRLPSNASMTYERNQLVDLLKVINSTTAIVSPKHHPVRMQYLLELTMAYRSLGKFDLADKYEEQARKIATVCYGEVNALIAQNTL